MALSENHWSVNEIMKIGGQDCIKNVEGVIVVSFEFQANGSIQQGRHLSCAENICCNTSVNCVVSSVIFHSFLLWISSVTSGFYIFTNFLLFSPDQHHGQLSCIKIDADLRAEINFAIAET